MTKSQKQRPGVGWWVCGQFHVFPYGNEDWHKDYSQEPVDGLPVPVFCQADEADGDACMDSSHLWGPFPSEYKADYEMHIKKMVSEAPPLSSDTKAKLRVLLGVGGRKSS